MRLTKDQKHVCLSTTEKTNDCLVVGGMCNRIEMYYVIEVLDLLGISLNKLIEINDSDYVEAYPHVNVKQVIEFYLIGRVYRKGLTNEV